MADKNIGALGLVPQLDDDSLLVVEQHGQAMKATGAQFKEFGRQAVISQVQGYVDQAKAEADRATDAVSAVTDMTVESSTLPPGQSATVTKTTRNGKVNLAFGLPRGEQGIPGPAGDTGPRGPQGPTGKGLTILGYYDTLTGLETAVANPEPGDAYGVGSAAPYDIYVFDGESHAWKNNGPLSSGGVVVPENVVTAEGGATMSFPVTLGDGPHIIAFDEEEEPPLTAEDIQYSDTENVKQVIDDLKSSVSNGKALIASAITDKGVPTAQDATFSEIAENIGQISGGSDTADATATSFDILAPKTAYTAAGKVEGAVPTLLGQTIVPGTEDKTIANGQYLGGTQVIKGDPNLTSSNIKKGVTIFGVEGALESTFHATLTVTADIGAVVTAAHTNGTEVEALSTTGTVVLELPIEGTWKVTAVRGMAQYNTVTIQVSSQYTASLTAEVHIERVGMVVALPVTGRGLAAASVENYAIFAGGDLNATQLNYGSRWVTAYDNNLAQVLGEDLQKSVLNLCGVGTDESAFFAGGYNDFYTDGPYYDVVNIYSKYLVKFSSVVGLNKARSCMAGTSINGYILFAGGYNGAVQNAIDIYDCDGTKYYGIAEPTIPFHYGAAATNPKYAIICGSESATAYDKDLTKQNITKLSNPRNELAAAVAGNYVLFAGGSGGSPTVDAYDLFLTRITAEVLSVGRSGLAGTSLSGYAIFGGGWNSSTQNNVDVYDKLLVKTMPVGLVSGKTQLAAATVSDYALFGGGAYEYSSGNYYSKTVEAYQHI